MQRPNLNDLSLFVAVAEAGSFTTAAAKIGISTSAVSHTIRKLEAELGVQLLNRTTRRIMTTEAGERLLSVFSPMLEQLDTHLEGLSELRDKPAGNLRISCDEHAVEAVLMPTVEEIGKAYPDIHIEIVIDSGLTDIVADRFDAGIRSGNMIAKDMIALPIGPELQLVVVAAPDYLKDRVPPQVPSDLVNHQCINLRLPTYGNIYAWEFEKGDETQEVAVSGSVTFNSILPIRSAALRGLGFAFSPVALVTEDIRKGRLVQVLSDWTPPYPGYHIYYPSARQTKPAFRILLETLRKKRRQMMSGR
ncbi:LysR family transcriptional regulator [uncultured Cohaesibacter sp.]|uniref:LysR family transcriptional regulator n=1 Tax=uncultured Cohaesibacter sp. TaxID=1002546 RepID=UPI00292D0009|nr:LysR family transcriptional regulator [uncultured Cohaesibacter sp.]